MMRTKSARQVLTAALLLSSLGLAGCAGDRANDCYKTVEREYGQVMMPVPCPPDEANGSGE
ncbi:MAG TPA: hypothetical protein VF274_11290 [Alphaproteobacteria bacterium]